MIGKSKRAAIAEEVVYSLTFPDDEFKIHCMETAQYIFVLIAASPFVIWGVILYGLSLAVPLKSDLGASLAGEGTSKATDGQSFYLSELPDVAIEHYYIHQTERTPYISS
ncbi:hypothetical protein BRY73_09935 [Ochrobactrum sp. P6BS-III]|uniref:hypothetical protein n=1 Tax=unclassified Ochrobactrum TaxID=239106 RepID=UPI000992047F|nr:hypothetical protein [Ochrobactrum sp. P6BSIII]OOL17594.1 hypothetical protein BRY73_09935 [Ochrobactrum sp. P6BS-III]